MDTTTSGCSIWRDSEMSSRTMNPQTGWLVRDPKGRVVVSGNFMVYRTRMEAVWRSYDEVAPVGYQCESWWAAARKRGYTVEKVSL